MSKRRDYFAEETTAQKFAQVFFYLIIPALLVLGTVTMAVLYAMGIIH